MLKKIYVFLLFVLLITDVWGKIVYVNCNAPSGGNGTLAAPFQDVQSGFNASTTGDEIRIAVGTYITPAGSDFSLDNKGWVNGPVQISGGWDATFDVAKRTLKATATVLKGSTGTTNSVVYVGNTHVTFDYLTFEGGNNTAYKHGYPGGGGLMFAATANLGLIFTVDHCYFKNNKCAGNGGAIGTDLGTYNPIYVQNSTFEGNESGYAGGAIFVDAYMFIRNNTFYNNKAGTGGGAICAGSGGVVLNQNTIVGNTAKAGAGGVWLANSPTWMSVFGNIIVGNTSGNWSDFYRDNNTSHSDGGYNIIGSYLGLGNAGYVPTTKLLSVENLYKILESSSKYVADVNLFTTTLKDNGGATPTIKLLTNKLPDGTAIDNVPMVIADAWTLRTLETTDQIGNPRPQNNYSIGAFEYYDPAFLPNGLDEAKWTPALGATVLKFGVYKYQEGTRFYNDLYDPYSVIECSYDGGASYKPQFNIKCTDQSANRGTNTRTYTIESVGGAVAQIRDNGVWKTIPNPGSITVTETNQSGYFQGEIRWQKGGAETNMIRKRTVNSQVYKHTLRSLPVFSTTTYLNYDATIKADVVWPTLTASYSWQANGHLLLKIAKPDFLPTSTTYSLWLNGTQVATKAFDETSLDFSYSAAELSMVKKYTIKCSYTPAKGLPPTYNFTSNELVVKAYAIPDKLNVSYDGCTGKNTINFSVPAITEANAYETSNFELMRAESADFTSNAKVVASSPTIAYSNTKTDYTYTDPDVFAANTVKTFYYKLRRVPLVAAWDWAYNVATGSVVFNSTHKQIKDITVSIVNGKPYIKWNYSADGVFCNGSKLTINRSINGQAAAKVIDITDGNLTEYTDNTTLSTCTPLLYSIDIGSSTHGYTTTAASNRVFVPLAAAEQPSLEYLKASKGFYNDRVELEWNLKKGTLTRFLVKRKLYEEDGSKFVTISDISITSAKLYKYVDMQSVPSLYYTYQIVAVTDCNGMASETPLLSDVGFRMPTGSVGGRIVYTGDVPVEGANIIIQGADQMKNRVVTLGAGSINIPDKSNILNPAAFTIQAWLNLSANAGTETLINKGTQFSLLKVGTKLQLKVGTITKDITGFVVPVNTYFHLSIVENTTTSFIVYINGAPVCTLSGFTAAVKNTNPIVIKSAVTGYLDELRIWDKALIASEVSGNYDRYISGKETGIKAYYRLDEKINEYVFDMSSKELVFNENHGTITGTCVRNENIVPTSQQLSLKGKTDANGNYLVGGIPYFADGTSYTFTPQLGTHEFNPKQKPLFLGEKSAVQNNVDFTDVSSFKFEGKVVYSGGTYPVEGVSFLIDGKPALDSKGTYIVTDADGKYFITVPIGLHTIEASKYGHTFSKGKFTTNFQQNYLSPSGYTFEDGTRIKMIGRVVGGKIESGKGLLVGQSKNNIGQSTIILEPLKKDKYDMRSSGKTLVDTLVKHDDGSLTRSITANNTFSILQKQITIKTSPLTGEFVAYIYPEDYKVLQVKTAKVDILGGVTSSIYLKNEINKLYEVNKWVDTILVPAKGSQLAYKKPVEKVDSILYHAKYIQTLIVDPEFSVTEVDSIGTPKGYNGNLKFAYYQPVAGTSETLKLVTVTNNVPTYTFGKPVYQQGDTYYFKTQAYEKYVNADNAVIDKVPVNSCKLIIDNTMKLENPNVAEELTLDSLGKGDYSFVAGVPDLTTGIKKFDAVLSRDNRQFAWAGKITSYLLGGKSSGANFTTAGPDNVIAILRDPPGSQSYSYLEKGSTISSSSSIDQKQLFESTIKTVFKCGPEIKTFAGLGFGVVNEAKSLVNISAGLHVQENFSHLSESSLIATITKRYETSSDPLWVGGEADLFIGISTNILYGATDNVSIMKNSDITSAQTTLLSGTTFSLVKSKGLAIGQSFATDFAYTQRDLEQIFIPAWIKLRDAKLLPKGTIVDPTIIKYPVYVSKLDASDPRFGSKNNDKAIWGNAATELSDGGPSYTIVLPSTMKHFSGTDSISWCNNQVNLWKTYLLENEKQKLNATLIKNQSFTSGAKFEYSENITKSTTTTCSWDITISGLIGAETGFAFDGMGVLVSVDAEAGGGRTTSSSKGSEESKNVGFVLQETGDFDALTVDYKKTADGTFSFNTRAGQTSCPYEGAIYTKYHQPGTMLSEATMRIENPKISVVNSSVSNVPANRNAVFELELKNESEAKGDAWYKLMLDGKTNPDGAILKVDGASITEEGRTFLVQAGQVLKKTLTLSKGPNKLDFKNIRLILASTCQYDPTDFTEDIYDDVNISASFIPNCTDISMTLPQNNWVLNTTTSDTMAVKLENYDVNYANFGYIALQVKNSSASTWSEEMKFYANSALYNAASGAKSMIDLKKNDISYKMKLPYSDNNFDVRAVAYCIDPVSKTVLAQTPTVIASGIKDMVRPTLFGLTQPSDGILNNGDEIQVQFNEAIAEGLISFNNLSVTGIKNGSETKHTTAVHFDGTANSMFTEQTMNLAGKSFTVELWLKRNKLGTGVILSHGGSNAFEFGFDANNKLYVKNGTTTVTSPTAYTDITTWNHYSVVYDVDNFNKVSVYLNGNFVISDQAFGAYSETGILRVGTNAAQSNFLSADMHELRVWEMAVDRGTIAANKSVSYSGIEKGLTGYWPMNEGKGKTTADKSRGRTATLNATWFINPAGKSVNLTGTASAITINTAQLPISASSDYSLELWFKGAAQTNACLFSAGRGDGEEYGASRNNAALWFNENGLLTFANNGKKTVVSTLNYLNDQWHHVAVSVNRLSTANIFVDGVLTSSIDARALTSITASNMYVGQRKYMSKTTFGTYLTDMPFKGQVDEVRIWNTALSESLVNQNINVRLQGDEAGLAAYYPFDAYVNSALSYTLNNQVIGTKEVAILAGGAVSNDYAPIKVGNIPENLGFDFVSNGDKINIKLTEQASVIERSTITFAVSDIQDKNGNILASPIVWNVYVDRSTLKWDNSSLVFNKAVNTEFSYTTRIVNTGATTQKFEINNIPSWMTVEPSYGSVKAQASQEITISVDKGLNVGAYDENLYLKSDYNEPLALRVNVLSEIPDWKVDPGKFNASMNIVSLLKVNDLVSTDANDIVAVFINGECCGVAKPAFYKELNKYLLYIKVYGNEAMQNGKLMFKVFDASSGMIYSGKPDAAIYYADNALQGTPSAPITISAKNEVYQITQLNRGWSWISFQVASSDLATAQGALNGMVAKSGDIIKDNAKGLFDSYFEANHLWTGTLTTGGGINNTSMYLLKSSLAQSLSIAGTTIDPTITKIPVKGTKWNYIAYIPSRNITTKEAMAGYVATANDVLKSQDAFAVYDATLGWIGDLKYMEPGRGYMLYRAGTGDVEFAYPKNVSSKKGGVITANPRITLGKYAETMNVVASVKSDFGFDENDWILGYNGAELVSATQMNEVKKQGANLVFANVQSENQAQIRFVLERDGKEIAKANEMLAFAGNTVVGNLTSPAVLNFKAISEEINIAAYPNPVTEKLTVKVNTLTDENVEITVCDLLGKTLIAPISESPVSHYAETAVNMNALKPGIYVVKIKVDGQMFVRKITKN
jgi:hypothetical protein